MSTLYKKNNKKIKPEEIRAYVAQVDAINKLDTKTIEQSEFVEDFLHTMLKIHGKLEQVEKECEQLKTYEPIMDTTRPPEPPGNHPYDSRVRDVIKTNELVRTPVEFDGKKPNPRRWIADYEDAASMNGWTNRISVKYFSTYLKSSALSWFKTDVKPLLTSNTELKEIVELFSEQYLGRSDEERLNQQVEETRQKPTLSVREFIPYYRELLLLLNPKTPEDEQMRRIIARLRPEYKPWIAMNEPRTIKELHSICIRAEAGWTNTTENKKEVTGNNKKQEQKKQEKKKEQNPGQARQPQQGGENTKPKCYRCGRMGHVSKYCRSANYIDGTPCREKPVKTKVKVNMAVKEPSAEGEVMTVKHVCSMILTVEDKQEEDSPVEIIQHHKRVNLTISEGQELLTKNILVNGQTAAAVMDTGATVSALDEKFVTEKGWQISPSKPTLVGPDGSQLTVLGTHKGELALTIGQTAKKTSNTFTIIRNLPTDC